MGLNKGHIPIRTCISCGAKRSKVEFIRLVLDGKDQLVRDVRGNMAGRGAYVCNDRACQEQLVNNRRINRAFRGNKVIFRNVNIDGNSR
ncbi:MAG: YlxR family protein [Pseudomonadota bacterium]